MTESTKTCTKCGEVKNINEFRTQTNRQGKSQRRTHCKTCDNAYIREWRSINRSKTSESHKRWREKNHICLLLLDAKRRAKKKGLEFNIDKKDIHIPAFCPLLSIPLTKGKGESTPNSPSIDRIDSSKGYVKGNVWIVSRRANTIKNDASIQEFIHMGKVLSNLYPHLSTECPQLNPKQI